ncbi:MAG: aminotransferase class III-fold pyridoxal phosphate-dependent enzyme [Candidatus Omnitrophica bacterium]|nr:aminotransferase class III-fold pyridoxal phosphate-dependent enzyme [Candidatus Omnitrophota bacterium]
MNTISQLEKKTIESMREAKKFLDRASKTRLLEDVGKIIRTISLPAKTTKKWFQKSYVLGPEQDDFLYGRDVFYITEGRKLFLDTTAGHYQMTWGYNHPVLMKDLERALKAGIAWDCHSNIPGFFVKKLSEKLVQICNSGKDLKSIQNNDGSLNTVLLGIATGSVACSTSMKIAINDFLKNKPGAKKVVFISLKGNYHGTDFLMQRLRGMWDFVFSGNLVFELVEPNDINGLKSIFRKHKENVAAFFFEPVMMNREAILLSKDFIQEARNLTESVNALMIVDEIQTCCWYPEIFMYKQFDITPDILILGKGLTAGFHPLSAIVYKRKLDSLKQYDAISTNGNAPLPAFMALRCLDLIEKNLQKIAGLSNYYEESLRQLAQQFPGIVVSIQGKGFLSGIKFASQQIALQFHRKCIERGIWLRVHAYYEGHSTALTKFALCVTKDVIDFTIDSFKRIIKTL